MEQLANSKLQSVFRDGCQIVHCDRVVAKKDCKADDERYEKGGRRCIKAEVARRAARIIITQPMG